MDYPTYQPTGRKVTIVLDQQALENYTKEYFRVYPRRRKIPIKEPIIPSLNKVLMMGKEERNNLKERWEEFVYHTIEQQGLLNLQLTHCEVNITIVFGNKRRNDLDNRHSKAIFDAFTRSGLIVDDNRFVIPKITLYAAYEKNNPHMVFELIEIEPY